MRDCGRVLTGVVALFITACAANYGPGFDPEPEPDAGIERRALEVELRQNETALNQLAASNEPDVCARACKLAANICELADRICKLADEAPSGEASLRCESARDSCVRARKNVDGSCTCS